MEKELECNRLAWDEMAGIHMAGAYPVEDFKAGRAGMKPNIPDDIGPVRGKELLHLQCHFGMDTLMWARQGAIVTGVDFSPVAISGARALAQEVKLDARFVESDVLELPTRLDGQFDIVLTYYGVLPWLPDLGRWAKVVAHFLKPGGIIYVADTHPFAAMIDVKKGGLLPKLYYPYFAYEPIRFESSAGTYADTAAPRRQRITYEWQHPLGEIVNSLAAAGLRIEYIHEFPYLFYDQYYETPGLMAQDEAGYWHLVGRGDSTP
ncbi:MAG: methyltransferase domain-containing protein, partial [Candidatus Brocadiia bacterium]